MAAKNELFMEKGRYEYFLEKYKGKIKPEILKQYKDADEYVLINEDKNLHPLWIKLPDPPEWHTIDGWGKPAKEQKFEYQVFPKKLQKLVDSCTTVDEIWDNLDERQIEFKIEISWIREQIERIFLGYWCFINGKPTFIDGWHYGYLNFWKFQGGISPEYRDRNRKFFHAMRYAYTTTESVKYNDNGKVVYKDESRKIIEMVDMGRRTMAGIIYPKHRRDGASNECLCAAYLETIYALGKNTAIISASGKHAQETLFDEIAVAAWQQMPFFLRPVTTSNENPGKSIEFFSSRSKANKAKQAYQLGSRILFSTTADASQLDGKKVFFLLADEGGKTNEANVYERHQVLRETLGQGAGTVINGFIMMPSTVGEMEGQGGRNYKELCDHSRFEQRTDGGQTLTGMMLIYMPAHEGLEGYIDEYGVSIVDDYIDESGSKRIGAKTYLESTKNAYLKKNETDKYNHFCRLYPSQYSECFRTVDGDIGFNSKKINEQIEYLQDNKKDLWRQGNFKWEGDVRDSRVYWEDDDVNGRFFISKILNEDQTNRHYVRTVNGKKVRFPYESRFTASADSFKFDDTQGGRQSDGGGAVFWDYDPAIDEGMDIKYWKTHRFVCTYLNRPKTKKEYGEDMLMMSVYFGSRMFPEIDFPYVWDYFEERGYGGYLHYTTDRATGIVKKTPGFNAKGSKQSIFNCIRDYIEEHCERELHVDFLEQCKKIESMDEMTDYDLITTCGGCLMATPGVINNGPKQEKKEAKSVQHIIPKRVYGGYMN